MCVSLTRELQSRVRHQLLLPPSRQNVTLVRPDRACSAILFRQEAVMRAEGGNAVCCQSGVVSAGSTICR